MGQALQIGNVQTYTKIARGLIKSITTDTIGYLWIATDEGVSRFDGFTSVLYKNEVAGGYCKSIFRLKDGRLLVAHDRGLTEIRTGIDSTALSTLWQGDVIPSTNQLYFPKDLYQDSKEQVWIGEDDAISRYDGSTFRKYSLSGNSGVRNIFHSIAFEEDPAGNLWAVSFGGKLFRYDVTRDTFLPVELSLQVQGVTCLLTGPGNSLVLGTQEGLYTFQSSAKGTKVALQKVAGPGNISCGIQVGGELFFGTRDKGLFRIPQSRIGKEAPQGISLLPLRSIVDIRYDSNNGLWVCNDETIALLAPGFFQDIPLTDPGIPVDALAINGRNELFVTSGSSVDRITLRNGYFQKDVVTQDVPNVKTAMVFANDRLWIGDIFGRVWYSTDNSYQRLQQLAALPEGYKVSQLLSDQEGNVWVLGTPQNGLIRIDSAFRIHRYTTPGNIVVQAGVQSPKGQLFFGANNPQNYLFYYHQESDQIIDISRPLPFVAHNNFTINQLTIDSNGDLLLATTDGLLRVHFTPGHPEEQEVIRMELGNKISVDEPILALAQSRHSEWWFSTTSGLVNLMGLNSQIYDGSSGISGNSLTPRGLLVDDNDNLWVGASRGLAVFLRGDYASARTPAPVLINAKINGIPYEFSSGQPIRVPLGANLELTYFAPAYPAEAVTYQYGFASQDTIIWENMTSRSVILRDLEAGEVELYVRAQKSGGYPWSAPLSLTLDVVQPWYYTSVGRLCIGLLLLGIIALAAHLNSLRLIKQQQQLKAIIEERTAEIVAQSERLIEQKNQIIDQQERYQRLVESRLNEELAYRNKQLTTYTLHLIQKNESLRELQLAIYDLKRQMGEKHQVKLKRLLSLIEFSFRNDEEWDRFKMYFEEVHTGFFEKLMRDSPDLTATELRLCALMRLNLSIQEIAHIMGISPESVKTSRFRLRKKLERESVQELVDYVMQA
ncbi:MAG: hypothetical protein H6555_10190 [Lewinellaceae bacterium]|nr:hypothetical protein [Lewinellaceae bacterium]